MLPLLVSFSIQICFLAYEGITRLQILKYFQLKVKAFLHAYFEKGCEEIGGSTSRGKSYEATGRSDAFHGLKASPNPRINVA